MTHIGTAVASPTPQGLPRSDRWLCFTWLGSTAPDWQRRDPALATPPLLVREWVGKPRSMLDRSCADALAAVGWLRAGVRQCAPMIHPPDPDRLSRLLGYLDHRDNQQPELQHFCRYGPCDALCHITRHERVVHWQHGLTSGQRVAWAIVPNRAIIGRSSHRPDPS
jgi:hypothetical protein